MVATFAPLSCSEHPEHPEHQLRIARTEQDFPHPDNLSKLQHSMDSTRSIDLYPPHRYSSGSGWCLTRHFRRRYRLSPPSASSRFSRSRTLPAVPRRLPGRSVNASSTILSAATAQSSTTPLSGSGKRKHYPAVRAQPDDGPGPLSNGGAYSGGMGGRSYNRTGHGADFSDGLHRNPVGIAPAVASTSGAPDTSSPHGRHSWRWSLRPSWVR
jgi:hypothetical protein